MMTFMNLKKFMATTAVMILPILILSLLFVQSAKANFVPYPKGPITDQPTITVYSPTQDFAYHDEVNLNFSIDRPDSWFPLTDEGWRINAGTIDKISYSLDENQTLLYTNHLKNIGDELPKTMVYCLDLDGLTAGNHTLTISVYSTVNYSPESPRCLGDCITKRMSTFQSASFTLEPKQTPISMPSPDLASSEPTSKALTSSAPEIPTWKATALVTLSATGIMVSAVALKRRKGGRKGEDGV